MDTLTTVVFLLDILSIQGDIKRKLHKKQISKLEKLIQLLYKKSLYYSLSQEISTPPELRRQILFFYSRIYTADKLFRDIRNPLSFPFGKITFLKKLIYYKYTR